MRPETTVKCRRAQSARSSPSYYCNYSPQWNAEVGWWQKHWQYTEGKGDTPVAILLQACTVQIKCQCRLGYDGVRAITSREWGVSASEQVRVTSRWGVLPFAIIRTSLATPGRLTHCQQRRSCCPGETPLWQQIVV